MRRYLHITIATLTLIVSCENNTDSLTNKEKGLKITIGNVCGWCAGGDSLVITENKSTYTAYNYCDKSSNIEDTITNTQDWSELVNQFDLNAFKKINLRECNVCADGCDTWIYIKNDTFSHYISFGYNDSTALQGIRPLLDKLEAMKRSFEENQ